MATDWHGYNEALIRRGEILLDLGLLKSWGEELEKMNGGREGGRYLYPDNLIRLQVFIRACFRPPYRQLEVFSRALSRWEPRLVTPDYSTTCRRVNTLDIGLQPHLDPDEPVPPSGFIMAALHSHLPMSTPTYLTSFASQLASGGIHSSGLMDHYLSSSGSPSHVPGRLDHV